MENRFLSITEVSALLRVSYLKAQNLLAEKGLLRVNPKKGAFLDEVLTQFPSASASQPVQDPYAFPPPSGVLHSAKALEKHLPFFSGAERVDSAGELGRLLMAGSYRFKMSGGYQRFYAKDFMEPDGWASPAEEAFKRSNASILKGLSAAKSEEEAATLTRLWVTSGRWAACLRDKRLGLWTVRKETKEVFTAMWEESWALVETEDWGSEELKRLGAEVVF